MAQERSADDRLMDLVDDGAVFTAAMDKEIAAEMDHAEPFIERGQRRFQGRQGICLALLCGYLGAACKRLGPGGEVQAVLLRVHLAASGPISMVGVSAAMSLGYALALADLAAVPPDDGAASAS